MLTLQDAVSKEVSSRTDDMRNLQILVEKVTNAILEKLQQALMRELQLYATQFETLHTRVVTLERAMQQFTGDLPSTLLVDSSSLIKESAALKAKVEDLCLHFAEQHSAYERRVDDLANELELQFNRNAALTDRAIDDIAIEAEELAKPHELSNEDKFRDFILDEFATIKSAITLESEHRIKTDDEILDSIKYYSDALRQHVNQN